MALRKCEHCEKVFWVDTELKLCPLCAVADKAEAKTSELRRDSNERQLQPAAQ